MRVSERARIYLKSFAQLGFKAIGLFFLYQIMLRLGIYRWLTPARTSRRNRYNVPPELNAGLIKLPSAEELGDIIGPQMGRLLAEADELVDGKIRLFGNFPVSLELCPTPPLHHWSYYESQAGQIAGQDIKFIWEPARFDWVYVLARAYHLTQDERYAEAFWRYTLQFMNHNPTNLGLHWVSGQEIALRLIALVFGYQVFCNSPTSQPERIKMLSSAIQAHAWRLPATLIYARAQNNNHLIAEAAGMITAAYALPAHPGSSKLLKIGRHYFHKATQEQIGPEGNYVQHSTNYHRLMLQLAAWIFALGEQLPDRSMQRLAAATRWLFALIDEQTGKVPNLGHNDGANIQPLAVCPYHDYRPVLASAGRAFLKTQLFPPGYWDENSLWLGIFNIRQDGPSPLITREEAKEARLTKSNKPLIIHHPDCNSHAYFRTARYTSRPAHADQLHVDLWWNGLNLAQDAGTYLYNASPPWENPFAGTDIHNTITIEGCDQMVRAGRFLWLDWAQAEILECSAGNDKPSATATHDGYRRFGLIHQRKVAALPGSCWQVEDKLISSKGKTRPKMIDSWRGDHNKPLEIRLHWLLPDWPYEIIVDPESREFNLRVRSPFGWIRLQILASSSGIRSLDFLIVRAGKLISGTGEVAETWGWVSPTYGLKIPALSLSIKALSALPLTFVSNWFLPEEHRGNPNESKPEL